MSNLYLIYFHVTNTRGNLYSVTKCSFRTYSLYNVGCVARMCWQNFATQPSHWSAKSAKVWRSDEPDHSPRRQTVDPKGQGQSFHLGSSSSCGDDPPISEEVVRMEHDETSFWLLVIGLGVHRVSQIDFGSQATPLCMEENV